MKTAHFLEPNKSSSQDLSVAVLSYTTDYNKAFKLEKVILHASQAITETVTISAILVSGITVVLASRSLVAKTDYIYRPEGEENFQKGDQIKVQCTAANHIGTVTPTVCASEL